MKTIDDYIQSKPKESRAKLAEMRQLIRAALPQASEALKWSQPAYVDTDGMILAIFAGYTHHMNLVVTPSAKDAFQDKLTEYKTGKGSIQFPYTKPLPAELIQKIVQYRASEYRRHGVKWK